MTPAEQAAMREAVLDAGRIGFDNGLACALDMIRHAAKHRPGMSLDALAELIAKAAQPEDPS